MNASDGSVDFRVEDELAVAGRGFRLINRFPALLILPVVKAWLYSKLPNVRNCGIAPGFSCITGANIFAEDVYIGDTSFHDYVPIRIGKRTMFSGENVLMTSSHRFDDFSIVTAKPITIGENVWITHRCIILGGVTIGDNSVIGAGSVVTRDVPANVFAAGNPCRVIRPIERA